MKHLTFSLTVHLSCCSQIFFFFFFNSPFLTNSMNWGDNKKLNLLVWGKYLICSTFKRNFDGRRCFKWSYWICISDVSHEVSSTFCTDYSAYKWCSSWDWILLCKMPLWRMKYGRKWKKNLASNVILLLWMQSSMMLGKVKVFFFFFLKNKINKKTHKTEQQNPLRYYFKLT